MDKENTKTVKQAWRKKPRKFAPKSRLGCKTCKIRRVKCDLSRPSCLKCSSTGRTCDGYSEQPLAVSRQTTKRAESESSHDNDDPNRVNLNYDNHHRAKHCDLNLHSLRPFTILPATGSGQAEAMCFFENVSIKHLNEHHPCDSWQKTLMLFSQTVPSVRHAAIALALTHRSYLHHVSSGSRSHPPQFSKDWLHVPDKTPLLHYNRAIQLLLNQDSTDSAETSAVTLLTCYLFICFDHLTGNNVQAVDHLRGGVELSRNMDTALLKHDGTELQTLIRQVTRQIRRLDMQAAMFLIDWTPADIEKTSMSHIPFSNSAFWSLDQAADHLQTLMARVMRLHWGHIMDPIRQLPPSSSPKEVVLQQLETWSSLFENMLQQGIPHETDPETHRLVSVMRLQHTMAWILLGSLGPGREMEYDAFLTHFQKCVAMAADVVTAHESYSGPLVPTFTPEIGVVPMLYIIGLKCRHPIVRREVLTILRRQPIREAIWDSLSAARVVERVIEIEESGFGEEGMTPGMEEITMRQRIEALSWLHDAGEQSVTKLDITYTFCGRKGAHSEYLII